MYSIMHLLTEEEGKLALEAARAFAESAVKHEEVKDFEFPEIFSENRGVFVTLTQSGELRGCIGFPYPTAPLGEALREAAKAAATQDPRFYPVREEELEGISFEVTILTQPEILECPPEERPKHITIGKHGLIASLGSHSGLLLPQVAEEYNWDAEEFLSQTCVKAGLYHRSWIEDDDCIIKTFEGQIFTETI
ncbi:MAG TPA: TIGR00296 family protein [Methanocorpusculum sp.]|nr:TIGR00296 family protein [Methanocorpusculum sp.]